MARHVCFLLLCAVFLSVALSVLTATALVKPVDPGLPSLRGFDVTSSLARPDRRRLGESGHPVPRFVSLKTDVANARVGPGLSYPKKWVYKRRGLPLEIFDEYGHWRHVRDWEGGESWIHVSQLSGARWAMVRPDPAGDHHALHRLPRADSRIALGVEPSALLRVSRCRGSWCEAGRDGLSGWILRENLWGVYRDEAIP